MENIFSRFWENLAGRQNGLMDFRFFIQPAMAVFLAVRDGVKDARLDRPPYFETILRDRMRRRGMLLDGFKSIARLLLFAILVDAVYQVKTFHWFYPGEALAIAFVLACLPYLLVRGPVCRVARRRGVALRGIAKKKSRTGFRRLFPMALAVVMGWTVRSEAGERWIDQDDPLERVSRVEARNVYRNLPKDGYLNSSILRIDFPIVGGVRIDVPYVTAGGGAGPSKSGFGDLLLQKLFILGRPGKLTWGGGFQFVFPTAADDRLGRGKYQAAPTFGAVTVINKKTLAVFLIQDYFSFSGDSDRPDIHELFIRASTVVHIRKRWWTNILSESLVNWQNDGRWFIPLSVELGRILTPHWTISARGSVPLVDDDERYDSEFILRVGYYFLRQEPK